MSLRVATWPLPSAPTRRERALRWIRIDARTAVPASLLLWVLIALGDVLTTAEVAFTLLYLAPVGIAVWFRNSRFGAAIALLSTASSFFTWLYTSKTPVAVLVWNIACECGVFLAFVLVLDRLRARVEEEQRGRETAVAQLRHAERLTTIGKLAAGVAHELGTPLNVISGRASLIADQKVVGGDALRSATIIQHQALRMGEIIQGLLAFARRGKAAKTATDLQELVRGSVRLLQPMARARGVEIAVEDGGPVVAPVSPREIEQVLGNLVVNAVQAMKGSGRVRVSVSSDPKEGVARIRVEDNGPGIPDDILPNVFDPFFTTKEVGEGTGLGLSVAFGIVRDHGGWFEVRTEVGHGTSFVVCLPLVERDAPPSG